jgi:hypothetical protein
MKCLRDIAIEFGERAVGGGGERAHDHVGADRKIGQALTHDVAQPTLDLVSDDGSADGLGNDESGTRRRDGPVGSCRIVMILVFDVRVFSVQVNYHTAAGASATGTDRRGEIIAAAKPVSGGQHR